MWSTSTTSFFNLRKKWDVVGYWWVNGYFSDELTNEQKFDPSTTVWQNSWAQSNLLCPLSLCTLWPLSWEMDIPPLSNQVVSDLIINYEHLWKQKFQFGHFLYYFYSTIELIHENLLMLFGFILFLQNIKKRFWRYEI